MRHYDASRAPNREEAKDDALANRESLPLAEHGAITVSVKARIAARRGYIGERLACASLPK